MWALSVCMQRQLFEHFNVYNMLHINFAPHVTIKFRNNAKFVPNPINKSVA